MNHESDETRKLINLIETNKHINKLTKEMNKNESKIMKLKLQNLNALIKKEFYDENDKDVFQINFIDKGDYIEFTMPLHVLFGRKTQEFAAKFWDELFEKVDIKTSFRDNIKDAVDKIKGLYLSMRLNKELTREQEEWNEFIETT